MPEELESKKDEAVTYPVGNQERPVYSAAEAYALLLEMEEEPLASDEYRCSMCRGIFKKGWTDEEAEAEQEANGWGSLPPEECAVVCDDCYQQMTSQLSPEEFNQEQEDESKDRQDLR